MIKHWTQRAIVSLALAGLTSACSQADIPQSADEPQTPTITAAQPEPAPERLTLEEMRAMAKASMDKALETQGKGEPALWRLADDDSTVYFLGTVHFLPPQLVWRSEQINAAFEASDTIVFEVNMRGPKAGQLVMRDFLQKGLFENGKTLRGALPDDAETEIADALSEHGLPLDAFNTFEPWMAAMQISASHVQKVGFSPNSGVESVLHDDAVAAGKSFDFLETIAEQTAVFDTLPMNAQIDFLHATALSMTDLEDRLSFVVEEWKDGDVAGIAVTTADRSTLPSSQVVYDAILVKRNVAWLPKIESFLDEPGTTFVAAGAAHFAGEDSVIKMLRDKGYEVEGPL